MYFESDWKPRFKQLLLCLAILGLAGCGLRSRVVTKNNLFNQPYILQEGDQLEVSVWGYPNMDKRVLIREDGTVTLPQVGLVLASGLSVRELEEEIQTMLDRKSSVGPQSKTSSLPSASRVISSSDVEKETYLLRIGDQINVSVWGHENLSQQLQISEDGSFSFPLIGNVEAVGKSLREIEKEIQERLNEDYIVNPHVTARLTSARFSVLGAVSSSGSYPIEGPIDLLTALSQAGGANENASGEVETFRERQGENVAIRANVHRMLKGEETVMDIFPRDTIYVKEKAAAQGGEVTVRLVDAKFSVLGEVKRPGTYEIEGKTDLLTAISLAGGINQFGSSAIEIVRGIGKEKIRVRINLDRVLIGKETNPEVFPRDTIFVRRRLF